MIIKRSFSNEIENEFLEDLNEKLFVKNHQVYFTRHPVEYYFSFLVLEVLSECYFLFLSPMYSTSFLEISSTDKRIFLLYFDQLQRNLFHNLSLLADRQSPSRHHQVNHIQAGS